nr:PREDICTED: Holliday junction recognition protein [Bos mutus]
MDGRTDGSVRVPAGDLELPPPDTPADAAAPALTPHPRPRPRCTSETEAPISNAQQPAVPWSPSKNELRRKYLTQVDILLQDEGCLECAGYGEGKDTHVTLAPSLALPTRPAQGYCKDISEDRPGGPLQPPPSPREGDASHSCSAGQAMMPRGDGIPLHGTGGGSFSSSPCSKGEDVCNATLSDLYAGMLHSMSRLLGARPSCIISTKTLIGQNWSFRRRHRCKGRMNRTSCRGGGRSRRSPQERRPPCSEPLEDAGTLRDRGNLPDVSAPKTDLKSGRALLKVNKPQIHTFTPPWKELQGMPQKHSSLTYLDSKVLSPLDQENRFVTLKWLISPVKIASRPRNLRGQAGSRFKEIEIKFDKLHQEYCLSPGKQLSLTYPPGSAVDVYRGGPTSPGSPQGLESHRLSSPLCKSKAKRLSEASEGLGRRSIRVGSCLPKSESFPSLSKTNPTCSAGRPEQTVDLVCLGSDSGKFQESVSFSKAISVPRVQPLGFARDRYDDIKEKFDKLHRQYCQKSPQQTQAPSDKARAGVRYQKEGFSVKFNPDSGCRGPPSLSSSPQQSVKSPLASNTVGAPPSMDVALAAGSGHQVPTKRCRLSDPQRQAGVGVDRLLGKNDTSFRMEETNDFVSEKLKAENLLPSYFGVFPLH